MNYWHKDTQNRHNRGYGFIMLAGILWGFLGFFSASLAKQGLSTSTIAFLRLGLGTVFMLVLLLQTGNTRDLHLDKSGLLLVLAIGLLGQAGFNFFYSYAIGKVGLALGAVLLYTSPVFVAVLSRLFLREHLTAVKVGALTINVVGCILTVTGGQLHLAALAWQGVAAGVLAGFLYALMTLLTTVGLRKYTSYNLCFYGFLVGAVALAFLHNPWPELQRAGSVTTFSLAAGYGLIPTVLAYLFYMKGIKEVTETSKVPVFASVELLVASLLGFLYFGESCNGGKIVGIICVVFSILLLNLYPGGQQRGGKA